MKKNIEDVYVLFAWGIHMRGVYTSLSQLKNAVDHYKNTSPRDSLLYEVIAVNSTSDPNADPIECGYAYISANQHKEISDLDPEYCPTNIGVNLL